ncbi:D-aminoacyl-tRNA deacylase [Alkalilimnicola sp. S0819]|uniref:D-aminoacyl-tRNA deacylase n=1 Tax=Alkalilimnicola sp. S0819 TaxID=2613922 RepID=UPI00126199C7|nr:D-aminoacyl-tRNA deacylase [Alkalilimnicola sp. S0819]KAB7627252.1 D-tyrosyl-tRNA(Tyr) deacylase [Alkalilimnicola sp. S0819]MPQ15965.1 D-tyrosyl-tRNA(Tyr) deacylase [Alkalilimnicola sp. S0819]
MIALLQRVSEARVAVAGDTVAAIGPGLLVLIGVQRHDTPEQASRLLERLLGYRVFADERGRMNRSLREVGGELLLVPQFTLAADTTRGRRPSFTPAAPPAQGQELFEQLLALAREQLGEVGAGVFGADMQLSLCNDGPVTFWLEVSPP